MPERRLSKDKFLADVEGCISKLGWVYIVCGEGVLWENGTPVSATEGVDSFSNIEYGAMGGSSAALNLHWIINQVMGIRGEFQITESLSMCAIDRISELDRQQAYECGARAVSLAEQEVSGVMVSIKRLSSNPYSYELSEVPLADVAIRAKPLPDEYINERGNFITENFINYAAPLIGEITKFVTLKNVKVKI